MTNKIPLHVCVPKCVSRLSAVSAAALLTLFMAEVSSPQLLRAQTQTNSQAPLPYLTATTLFSTQDSPVPYRIPAIAQTKSGRLIALTDYRWCHSDIGFGRVDIRVRISEDYGMTWGKEQVVVEGTGIKGDTRCGYGDPAIVADRNSGEVLVVCVTGNTPYGGATRGNPNRVAIIRSHDEGRTWDAPIEITEKIYTLFDDSALGPVQSLFFGSGRICQSRKVKVGRYYRVYAALCARPGGNRVVYSDDFGETWHSLGPIDSSPAPNGDEPKIAELPDGRILLSSRPSYNKPDLGRYFNIYSNGEWEGVVPSSGKMENEVGNSGASVEIKNGVFCKQNVCNGEILILKARRKDNGRKVNVALQSLPLGPGRTHVCIFWKVLNSPDDYRSPVSFASNWDGYFLVSDREGAYSTMIQLTDGRIAFYWEDLYTPSGGYEMMFTPLSIERITGGKLTAA